MLSLKSLRILIWLPFQLLNVTLQYLTLGLVRHFRRYRKNLRASLLMVIARAVLGWNVLEGGLFNKTSLGAVLLEVASAHLGLVKHLHNYGKRFLERAWWLVEQKDRGPDDLVLIYCHGGGYFLQLSSSQAEALLAVYCLLSKRKRVSILILDYRLACNGHTFPAQMEDLYELYYQLANSSSRIGLLGDSAGGNLAVGFTQYLQLKNAPLKDYPLVLAVISPWLLLSQTQTLSRRIHHMWPIQV